MIATGGGADHMKKQLACIQVPLSSTPTFVVNLEYNMGTKFEVTVNQRLFTAGQIGRQLVIAQGNCHHGVPAVTIMVDIRAVISTPTMPTLVLE